MLAKHLFVIITKKNLGVVKLSRRILECLMATELPVLVIISVLLGLAAFGLI